MEYDSYFLWRGRMLREFLARFEEVADDLFGRKKLRPFHTFEVSLCWGGKCAIEFLVEELLSEFLSRFLMQNLIYVV